MTAPLVPRGPDGEGFHVEPGIALGHRRLSIIDPAGGAQPMATHNQRYQIVYNGEVYNYIELRRDLERAGNCLRTHSDTEAILSHYAMLGAAALQRFNGMFALAIWDRDEQRLLLARDRIGIKPLYYCLCDGELIFASELKALLVHPRVERRLDHLSVSKYFTYGYVPAPHTIFESIYKLQPGYYLLFDHNGLKETCYWDIPLEDNPASEHNVEEWAETLLTLLRDSVSKHLRSDVPVGVLLSGGLDSSLVTALATQKSSTPLHTFSIGFDQPTYDESPYARRVASFLGTQHHEEILTLSEAAKLFPQVMQSADEPLADASILPTYALSRLAGQHVKVVLGGDGADELFAGYPSFQLHKVVEKLSFLPLGVRDWFGRLAPWLPVSHRYASLDYLFQQFLKGRGVSSEVRFLLWMGIFSNADKKQLLSDDLAYELLRQDSFEDVTRYVRQSRLKGDFQRLQYLAIKLYLQDDVLTKVDRASMARSLEVRVPYLDRDLIEAACRIQPGYKLHGLTTKYVLKRVAKGILPDEIIHRRKTGFMMPVAKWLREEMRETIEDLCSPDAVKTTGLFNASFVRQLLDEHFEMRRDHRKQIYALLCFMSWLNSFGERTVSL